MDPAPAKAGAEIFPAEIGKPVRIDDIAAGTWRQFDLDGIPVFVRRLTVAQMQKRKQKRAPAEHRRAEEQEWVVVSGVCTHAGCTVVPGLGPYRGFACFCHGSEYDEFGIVRHGPAKQNLAELCHAIMDGSLTIFSVEPCAP